MPPIRLSLRPGETYLAAFSRLDENSDWFTIVQHDRSVATAPVTQLAEQIQWLGWMAFGWIKAAFRHRGIKLLMISPILDEFKEERKSSVVGDST